MTTYCSGVRGEEGANREVQLLIVITRHGHVLVRVTRGDVGVGANTDFLVSGEHVRAFQID